MTMKYDYNIPERNFRPKKFSVITRTSDTVDLMSGDYSNVDEDQRGGVKPLYVGSFRGCVEFMSGVMIARDIDTDKIGRGVSFV